MGTYTVRDAARILRVSPRRLRYWRHTQLVRTQGDAPAGDLEFRDLVLVKAVVTLLDHGVPLQRIRQSVDILRDHVPELEEPLAALRVWSEGSRRVVVHHEGRVLEPDGQLLLDFAAGAAAPARVSELSLSAEAEAAVSKDARGALEWFEIGCGFDSDPSTYQRALDAYREAVRIDPGFADAHCNLGAVFYNKGSRPEARHHFERCLELEPAHVEAHFNLANLLEEDGGLEAALQHYLAALRRDPLYGDLHVNLALLYERLGRAGRARDHWRRYLQIEPHGSLAEIAQQRLRDGSPGPDLA